MSLVYKRFTQTFLKKYLLYKKKYIDLKNQYGGMIECKDLNALGFHNKLGTCWNITILSIFLFGEKTKDRVQSKLLSLAPEQIITDSKQQLELFLPNNLLDSENKLLPKTQEILVQIVTEINLRFLNKLDQASSVTAKSPIQDGSNNELPDPLPAMMRQPSDICEKNFIEKFFTLFRKTYKEDGGRINESYYLTNLLSIIFLNKIINFHKVSLRNINNSHYYKSSGSEKNINTMVDNINLSLLDQSIGIELRLDNEHISRFDDKIKLIGHSQGFFTCEHMKFVDNNIIIDYDYRKFFETIYKNLDKDFIISYDNNSGPYLIFPRLSYVLAKSFAIKYNIPEGIPQMLIHEITFLIEDDFNTEFFRDKLPYYKETSPKDYYVFLSKLGYMDELNKELLTAIENKELNIIKKILLLLDTVDDMVLIEVIKMENINIITEVLKKNPNLDKQDDQKYTPLMLAIKYMFDSDIIKLLLDKPQNYNLKNNDGDTALMLAIKKGNFGVVKLIASKLDPGSIINTINNNNETALMIAINTKNIIIVEYLLTFGHDFTLVDIANNNILMIALEKDDWNLSRLILSKLDNDSILNNYNAHRMTPLMIALKKNNIRIIELLLRHNIDLNHIDKNGDSILIFTIKNMDNLSILELILRYKHNFDHINMDGMTALMVAIELSKPVIVEKLLQYPQNLEYINKNPKYCDEGIYCKTALMMAIKKKNKRIVELLLEVPQLSLFKTLINTIGDYNFDLVIATLIVKKINNISELEKVFEKIRVKILRIQPPKDQQFKTLANTIELKIKKLKENQIPIKPIAAVLDAAETADGWSVVRRK